MLVAYDPLEHDPFDEDDVHVAELFTARATLALGMSRALASERERSKAEQSLVTAEQRQESQREMLRRVVGTQEAERRRIARELHDDTGQALASVLLGLRRAEELEDPAERSASSCGSPRDDHRLDPRSAGPGGRAAADCAR